MIFILAKDANIAKLTARLAGLQPKDWCYPVKADSMMPHRQASMWITETGSEHTFYRQIIALAMERDFMFFDVHQVQRHHLIRELGGAI